MKNSALNYAMWLLSKRDRSVGQIEEKLLGKEYSQEEVRTTVRFLLDKNFLSDERFAENYIRNQIIIKPLGKYQLKQKLKKKLVPSDIIEQALGGLAKEDELALSKEVSAKWLRSKYQVLSIRYKGDKNKIRNSLVRHLVSRGFNFDDIKETVDAALAQQLDTEY